MKTRMTLLLAVLVILALACNLSNTSQPTSQATSQGTSPATTNLPQQPSETQPTGTPEAQPISINDGLSSLNSYQLDISFNSSGPDPKQSTTSTVEVQRSKDQDARLTHYKSSSTKKDSSSPSELESYIYRIGNDRCSGLSDNWTWTSIAANSAEMQDLVQNMIGIIPLIENPSFVSEETVNGVDTNHFSFKVSGLGEKSGAEVTANQGDYWLAVDGQYLVKYDLVAETSMGPNTDVLHEEVHINLTNINQPIEISFPAPCLSIKPTETPTP